MVVAIKDLESKKKLITQRIFTRLQEIYPKRLYINKNDINFWWYPSENGIEQATYLMNFSLFEDWVENKTINILKEIMDGLKFKTYSSYKIYPPTFKQFKALYSDLVCHKYGGRGDVIVNGFRFIRAPIEGYLLAKMHQYAIELIENGFFICSLCSYKEKTFQFVDRHIEDLIGYIEVFKHHQCLWPIYEEEIESFPLDRNTKDIILKG